MLDGFFQVGAPVLYITDLIFLGAVTFLFLRRVIIPQVRYISLASDYFPLFLIFGIGLSGVLMRYFFKTDIVGVKELTMGLMTFNPVIPQGIDIIFYIHLFLVSILLLYFPMSKLMHMAGVFLSPTRNLANNNRAVRHVNPWDYPVKVHTYDEYEDDFREVMKESGLPVEKE
jgi:nitrate reductase gamma subunit